MVKIKGNGAVKVNGRYIFYKEGVPAPIPESVAKRIGKEYEVITADQVHKAVVTQSEKRDEVDEKFLNLPDDTEFPHHYGGGSYYLSNGEKVRGKQEATQAQNDLES